MPNRRMPRGKIKAIHQELTLAASGAPTKSKATDARSGIMEYHLSHGCQAQAKHCHQNLLQSRRYLTICYP